MSYGTPPPPPPPGYGPGPSYPGGYPGGYVAPTNSGKAIAALVLGILSLICCGVIGGILAIVFGRIATKEIDRSGGALTGRGMATAGWILGIIGIALNVIVVIVFVVAGIGGSGSSTFLRG